MGKILDMRRTIGSQDVLPKGVVPIEYLESSGPQFIDTGIADTWYRLIVTLDMTELPKVGERNFFGNYGNTFNYAGCFTSLGNDFVLQLGQPYVRYGYNDNKRHTHVYDAVYRRAGIDGIYFDAPNLNWNATNNFHFFLFERPDVNGIVVSPSANRLYGAIFERDGETIRDFIPVRIGTIGYMYDKVSGQLFGNAGTGEFILGQDK